MILRKATLDDIPLLIEMRFDFLEALEVSIPENNIASVITQLSTYFSTHISDNTFIAIIAEIDNKAISAAYLAISEKPASPAFITGKTATLLNVITYPEFRKKGIATQVITLLMDEAKQLGVSFVDLAATSEGKPLYEKLGFTVSKYTAMGKQLI